MGVAVGSRSERCGAAPCAPRRAVPAVRSPPGRGARPWQRSGRCCACGRRRCRTIWLSPCRKGVAALRLREHVTVRGGRVRSFGGGRWRAPARPHLPRAGRAARGAERGKAGARLLSPLSPSLPAAASPPPSLHTPLVVLPPPLGCSAGNPVVLSCGGGVWGACGVFLVLRAAGARLSRAQETGEALCWLAKAGSSGRRGHACLKQPPAALGTWSSGPGGCAQVTLRRNRTIIQLCLHH
ncbi:uncharacterized protein LOC121666003 [Corvus kubaryi]|uniref:uncharacterized protein LOC121666003 n=1 Tax=Corvus kubaryi TaxID=68294 RepID=UPI001C04A746|nr:uncharacterized protein LOC121666003 [Corvus kubaryi]